MSYTAFDAGQMPVPQAPVGQDVVTTVLTMGFVTMATVVAYMGYNSYKSSKAALKAERQRLIDENERLKTNAAFDRAVAQLTRLFHAIDTDHSGEIDYGEFRDAALGKWCDTEASCKRLFTILDDDGSGEIDVDEFILGLLPVLLN